MASSYMSTTQTVSSKLCAGISSFRSCSVYNGFHVLSMSRTSPVNPSFRLDLLYSNRKTLKHKTRTRKLGSESEEEDKKEKEDEEDYLREDDDEEDYRVEEDKKDDYLVEEAVLKLYTNIKDRKENKDHYRAEEAVLKLYTDIKDRNISGISEVIGDECQCFCNFLSSYRLLQGKKQVMAFFYWLMMKLGKDIKIIVKPTSKDGMTVGVQWQLEWEKPHIQLGKGVSFHICHIYQGKLLIKNVEMFMEPIFHIEPLRLRTMAFAVSLAEKMVNYLRPIENIRRQAMTVLLLALLLLATAAFYFTQPRL